jgi:hypothetical protein
MQDRTSRDNLKTHSLGPGLGADSSHRRIVPTCCTYRWNRNVERLQSMDWHQAHVMVDKLPMGGSVGEEWGGGGGGGETPNANFKN